MGRETMTCRNASETSRAEAQVPEDVFHTASSVVEAILANFASIYGSSFFQPLSEIAFVPAEMGLPIASGSARRKVLASYKELVLMKDWPLAWTCAPILTNNSLVPPEFSWRLLHLQSPPQIQTVLRHLEVIMLRIYSFLQKLCLRNVFNECSDVDCSTR
jgi:sacsin